MPPTSDLRSDDENEVTEALAKLLREDRRALGPFLQLARLRLGKGATWTIETQVGTDRRKKIDLLLRTPSKAVIVEAKIRDVIKAFQFDSYRDFVRRKYAIATPVLLWLVRKPRDVDGEVAKTAIMVTWNDLAEAWKDSPSPTVRDFASELVRLGIAVPAAAPQRKRRIGYEISHARRILNAVRGRIAGLTGGVEENSGTPLSLHVGREVWVDGWRQRCWLYLQPRTRIPDTVAPYGYASHILLFHADHEPLRPSFVQAAAETLAAAGCKLRRSGCGSRGQASWQHEHQMPFTAPYHLTTSTGIKYVYAIADHVVPPFDWRDDRAAVDAGVLSLEATLCLWDEVEALATR